MNVPIVLEDLAGRRIVTFSRPDVSRFVGAVPNVPVGAFVFWKTADKDDAGRPIFRQAPQLAPAPASPDVPPAIVPAN